MPMPTMPAPVAGDSRWVGRSDSRRNLRHDRAGSSTNVSFSNRERAEDHALTQKSNSIDQIAAWVGALDAAEGPPAAFAIANKGFLDTLAVSLRGSHAD